LTHFSEVSGLTMSQIQGLAAHAAGAELLPFKYDPGELGRQQVEIAVTHCGVCHSDLHLIANDWGISQYPFIPGHEIIGKITAIGDEVQLLEVGQRVGLGWQSNSCGVCEWCSRGMENLCPEAEGTCVHRHGGYADSVRAHARFVIPIPEALESESAAPLLCGGITVYNPLRTHGVNPSSRVGIVGIGGLGHLAIQFARIFGAEVTAFSTSAGKEEEAERAFEHALEVVEDNTVVKRYYAPWLMKKGDLDRAMDFYEDVLDVAPNDISALTEYAQTLEAAGREFEVNQARPQSTNW